MKDNMFLDLLQHKRLPRAGICGSLPPTCSSKEKKIWNLFNQRESWCWGYGEWDEYNLSTYEQKLYEMTPLRQTILVLCNEIYQNQ